MAFIPGSLEIGNREDKLKCGRKRFNINNNNLKSWEKLATCHVCNREFITTKYKLDNNKKGVFCSRKCYADFQREQFSGKSNPRYTKKISVICDNCGKHFEKIPSLTHNINKQGESHNFCCYECYWEYRRKYYVGDKLYNTGKKMDQEFCNKVRNATLKQYSSGNLNRQTKPQRIINSILDECGIHYENEKIFKYYSVDNYLPDYNLILEIMGDYFHANPLLYPDINSLDKIQEKDVYRDKRKNTYLKRYYNIDVLYIWETDIKNNPKLCKELILKYIENNGKLDDYNSFNFSLYEEKLAMNKNIIKPHFNPLTTKL